MKKFLKQSFWKLFAFGMLAGTGSIVLYKIATRQNNFFYEKGDYSC